MKKWYELRTIWPPAYAGSQKFKRSRKGLKKLYEAVAYAESQLRKFHEDDSTDTHMLSYHIVKCKTIALNAKESEKWMA